MKKYLLMMLSVFAMSFAWAQERTITGKVTDAESGETIPGANIIEKGTSNGTITDFDGNYRITVGDGATLVVSFVGYTSTEVPIGAMSVVDVALELDVQSLSEVVVVGYGTQDKKEITSAVASVGEEEFNVGNITSPEGLLQGKVAGLSIVTPSGDPNAGPQIRLRGLTTFGANSQPLIVLDGVVGADLANVDPSDIESIDVLKDGSAAAIYGARGSSGVILVTTKSGKSGGGTTRVNYNGFVAMDMVANRIDVLSASEFVDRGGIDFGQETDWFDELTDIGVSQTHNLSVSGSLSPNTTYRASANFRDNNGIVINSGFQRVNTRLAVNHAAVNGRLRLSFSGAMNNREQEGINNGAFRYAVIYNPTAPIFESGRTDATAAELANADSRFGGYFQRELFDFYNPVALANQQTYQFERTNVLTNYKVAFDIFDELTATVNYAADVNTGHSSSYWSKQDFQVGFGANGRAERTTYDNINHLAEATLNYTTTFGDLDFSALLGVATQIRESEGFGVGVRQFLYDNQGANSLGLGGIRIGANTNLYSYKTKDELNSAFVRLNGTYDNTFFFSASVRAESYSGFGENEKTGYFPAVSAGAELTELIDMGPVNSLKLRASYGITGNLPPDPYLAIASFGPGATVDLDGDPLTTGDVYVSPSQTQNPNPTLKWETKTEIDVGVDFTIFDKISGTMDYYTRNIADLLFRRDVTIGAPNEFLPGSTNTVGSTWANIGNLQAGGFEFQASYNGVELGPVVWTPTINFTYYDKTRIEEIEGLSEIRLATPGSPGQNNNEIIRNSPGEVIGNIYGPELIDFNDDGTYNLSSTDPTEWGVIGNGLPDGEFGFNNQFVLGDFDLNFFFRGAFGHDIYNSYRGFYENADAGSTTWNSVVTDKTPSGANFVAPTSAPTFSDLYIERANFIRLDNAQIGYNVPVESDIIERFRVYAAGQNLLTITDYTGIDPEVKYNDTENGDGFTTALAPGLERRNQYFTRTTITLGVNITFK